MFPVKLTMKTFAMLPTICMNPVRRGGPVAASPHPMVIAPSPTSTDPGVTRRGTGWCDLNDRRRHGGWHDNWGRGYYNRGWNRNSEVDTDTDASVYRGDSESGQGQNCNCLFHSFIFINWTDRLSKECLQMDYSLVRQPAGISQLLPEGIGF